MKNILFTVIFAVIFSSQLLSQTITQQLQDSINNSGSSDKIPITIRLTDEYDYSTVYLTLDSMSRTQRRDFVVGELKAFAYQEQLDVINILDSLTILNQVNDIESFWIINMITCNATPVAITQISLNQDVEVIDLLLPMEIELEECNPVEIDPLSVECEIPWHITQMNVDQVWQMGYYGCGVVVAVIDQGVNYNHPNLEENMWDGSDYGYYKHGYDFVSNDEDPLPDNFEDHGTHVAGIIAGKCSSSTGYSTGIAPSSRIMSLRVLDQSAFNRERVFSALEFALEHGADIINLSLGERNRSNADFYEVRRQWRNALDNVIAAGCVAVAGVGQPSDGYDSPPFATYLPACIPSPWKHPDQIEEGTLSAVIGVGATDQSDLMWYQSYFGPSTWHNVPGYDDYPFNEGLNQFGLIKPDVVAPGVSIISTIGTDGYGEREGTSMSTAMVSGVIALILGNNPELMPKELDSIVQNSAVLLSGQSMKNNVSGSGRVNAYNAMEQSNCQIEIAEDIVWSESKSYFCDIIVKDGNTLTISNAEIEMGQHRKIVVEPGATLVLNNTVIRNKEYYYCPVVPWQGIEVWGNSSTHQWPDVNGNYQQGRLVIENSSIENALVAINLWKDGDYSKTGGIVNATNTTFINNVRSVHALLYRNFHPVTNDEMPYSALFNNCAFQISSTYPGYETFYKHIDLNQVNGVRFRGCDFTLSPDAVNVSASSMGIGSYGSGFRVNALCNSSIVPCNNWDKSSFNGFTYGIYATKDLIGNNTFEVSLTDFTNNIYGINSLGVNNLSVLNSTFALRKNAPEAGPCQLEGSNCSSFGINMIESSGFVIEENSFAKASGAPTGYYTGIRCKDGKSEHDIIYLNTFNGLSYGNFAEGLNRLNPSEDFSGLEYRCNTNSGNSRDFIVAKKYILDEPQIRTFQGTQNKEAGNIFSTGVLLPDGHFKNTGTQVINYFYNSNPPVYYTPNYVVPIQISGVNNCLPRNGGSVSELVMTTEEKQSAELDFYNNLTFFNNVKALFDNLKDGGNTAMLKSEVETAWPGEMWELREKLLGKSPHLSQEVLMAAADKTDVLPESVLFEILSANPDELRKEDLINYLENKEQPLPAYMVSILRQLTGGITYKTILLQDMADYQAAKTQAANALVRSCLNDSIIDQTYLRSWLNNLDNLNADMQIVSSFMASQDYASAQTMLDLIPSTRGLVGNQLDEFNDYKTLVELQITLNQQGRSIFELDSTEQALVTAIAAGPDGKGQLMARNLLTYAYGHQYYNCLPVDDTAAMKSTAVMQGAQEADNGMYITVMPNPASTWAAFEYKLPAQAQEALLQITDTQGKNVTSFALKAKQGQQLWDIRDVKKGTYFYILKAGNQSKSGKLIIQ
jgi:serine protease AprX